MRIYNAGYSLCSLELLNSTTDIGQARAVDKDHFICNEFIDHRIN